MVKHDCWNSSRHSTCNFPETENGQQKRTHPSCLLTFKAPSHPVNFSYLNLIGQNWVKPCYKRRGENMLLQLHNKKQGSVNTKWKWVDLHGKLADSAITCDIGYHLSLESLIAFTKSIVSFLYLEWFLTNRHYSPLVFSLRDSLYCSSSLRAVAQKWHL